ncbi:MAG: sigma-70 family RNA polymerase sigma factor [Gemmataceae bacterium]|nr:sigma-70 family RNA polymerase sigma factor [Gemmataceae bacterium]MDW8265681.1 sigma-70 family RNA polymerase sigma factor [Gemmataceae bacterium]
MKAVHEVPGPTPGRRPLRGPQCPRVSSWEGDDADVALMFRVQRDEPGAFAELIDRYRPRVFAWLYRRLRNQQDAEDMTQNVFWRLYRARRRYRPTARLSTWIYHITQNVVRNALRSRRRKPCVPIGTWHEADADAGASAVLFSRSEEPSQPIERAELRRIVRRAVAGLATRQRTALELHQFHNQTYTQVAAELDMSPQAVKSLLHRARLQLRSALGPVVEALV